MDETPVPKVKPKMITHPQQDCRSWPSYYKNTKSLSIVLRKKHCLLLGNAQKSKNTHSKKLFYTHKKRYYSRYCPLFPRHKKIIAAIILFLHLSKSIVLATYWHSENIMIWIWKSSPTWYPNSELTFFDAVSCYLITRATVVEFWTAKSQRNESTSHKKPTHIKIH